MKIAIFGGSFDPPHLGHMAVIDAALHSLDIDRLIIVPAYLNPFKTHSAAPAELRLEWLKKLIDDPRVLVSDYEVSQAKSVPTFETVCHFADDAENIYLIIGSDNLASLQKWYRFEALDAMVEWVIATRNSDEIESHYRTLKVDVPISSTQLRESIDIKLLPETIAEEIINFYKEDHAKTH